MRGLIGYPLGHSYSKIIHEAINHKSYDLFSLNEEEFKEFMDKKEFECINVTIPYKEKVIPYLHEIETHAQKIGAINCIVNDHGHLTGYNTDYYGFKYTVEHNGFVIKNKKVAILGPGGAYKAVFEVISEMEPLNIYSVSRNKKDNCITYDDLEYIDPEILINTTPVGMYPNNDDMIYDIDKLNRLEGVIDVIYNPINTKLVLKAKERGIKAVGGLEMLVAQAVKALEIFDHQKYDDSIIDKTYEELLRDKLNIVLIGMPSSGKTTIASILQEKLGYETYEMDDIITDEIKMPIKDYFDQYGEEAFRDKETACAKALRNKHHAIISCGGGVIKRPVNIQYLKENGFIIFIDRNIDKLIATDDRPLSNDFEKLNRLYLERYDLYRKYSDITISNNGDINDTVNQILESRIIK